MIGMRRLSAGPAQAVGLLIAAVASGGCNGSNWLWTSFLDPTQVSGDFKRTPISEIQRSLSFEDTPPGIPGAEEPTAEDLVATAEERLIEPDDVLYIEIPQFVEYEPVTRLQLTVSEVGDIQIPQLGWIHVEGMSAKDVEAEIRDLCVQKGIFKEGGVPPITITFLRPRQRYFNIFGGVAAADTYRILETDFRLLDALSLAGGLPEQVDWVYVYRAQPRPKRTKKAVAMPAGSMPSERALPPERGPEAPPVAPVSISDMGNPGSGRALVQASPAPKPTTSPESERELIDVIAPATKPAESAPAPAAGRSPSAPEAAPRMPKFIYLNGQWVEEGQKPVASQAAPVPAPAKAAAKPATATAPATTQPGTSEPVTWESVAAENRPRIIRVPADALRRGDGRYNIVIRHRDVVRVDPGPLGEFFLLGQVARPGVYSLTGREVTLKQAIAAAGGLGILAWPSRCEITRRLDQDREQIIPVNLEQIFAGNQPDVYIRTYDIVNVGTNIVAPFLATIRTSFRMSYGFGFVYDRNFGDIDAYEPKSNPHNVDLARRAARRSQLGLLP
jgi:polysaccharide export outer membrane protein